LRVESGVLLPNQNSVERDGMRRLGPLCNLGPSRWNPLSTEPWNTGKRPPNHKPALSSYRQNELEGLWQRPPYKNIAALESFSLKIQKNAYAKIFN
jgi:hypothetical protein